MPLIHLKYGSELTPFEYEASRFDVLQADTSQNTLTDAEIGLLLDEPIDSPPLEEIIAPGESVLFVVPDATRQTAAGQVVNLIVRRLIANGSAPHDIRVIFATGIHRKVTEAEKALILSSFIVQRIKTLDHDPRDLMQLADLGKTPSGIEVSLNRALIEHDHVVTVGGVSFHYFAGFTGGRKLICPGLASSRTIARTHRLAFDFDRRERRSGVGTALLDNNPVHEAFMEVVAMRPPSFSINTIVNDAGNAIDLFCGDWKAAHRSACGAFMAKNQFPINERRELVIASCGGLPYDLNLIQAHKALDAASRACRPGGTIVLFAECRDGFGRPDFLKWFEPGNSRAIGEMLAERYQVNGQTAWSLMEKAERFEVLIVTDIDDRSISKMGMKKVSVEFVSNLLKNVGGKGYIFPNAARSMVVV